MSKLVWIGRVPEQGHARCLRYDLLEQLHPLCRYSRPQIRHASDVPTGPREGRDDAGAYRIPDHRHDDGNGAGRLLGRLCRRRAEGGDDVDLETDELVSELWKPTGLPQSE